MTKEGSRESKKSRCESRAKAISSSGAIVVLTGGLYIEGADAESAVGTKTVIESALPNDFPWALNRLCKTRNRMRRS